jgi:hypothetical protein
MTLPVECSAEWSAISSISSRVAWAVSYNNGFVFWLKKVKPKIGKLAGIATCGGAI